MSGVKNDFDDLYKIEDEVEEGDGQPDKSSPVLTSPLDKPLPADAVIYNLKLTYSHEVFFAVYDNGGGIKPRSHVVVQTRFGRDLAAVVGVVSGERRTDISKIAHIERVANANDLKVAERNQKNEEWAFQVFSEKMRQNNLAMKLIKVHYMLEEPKILFLFTAESRVDFRELVKDLKAAFKMQVELRQVGMRDESRVIGGCGICGRQYCCNTVSDKIKSVSIKMAKEQNLSLNSMKISGSCGRLLCCLSYEYQFYSERRKFFPAEGCKIEWDKTTWRVKEINVILGLVTIDSEDGRQLVLNYKKFEKIENRWRITETPIAAADTE